MDVSLAEIIKRKYPQTYFNAMFINLRRKAHLSLSARIKGLIRRVYGR